MAALPLVHSIAFPAPSPTVLNPAEKAVIGWTPRTTPGPRHRAAAKLGKRQTEYIDKRPELCGWIDFGKSSLACSTDRICVLYTVSSGAGGVSGGMAGCCASDNSQDCGWVNSCVPYDAWTKKSCDAACQSNTFVRKCTNALSPYCVTWTYPSDGAADYGCADDNSGVVTVTPSWSDSESVYRITLPTLSGEAVTGWDGEASSSVESESPTSSFIPSTSVDPSPSDPEASGNSNSSTPQPQAPEKKTSVGLIAGAAIGGLVVLFLIGAAVIFFCVKRRKAKQIANNQTIIAAQQAQSQHQNHLPEYKPPIQAPPPPAPIQSPHPQQPGYYAPHEQKVNYQTHVHDQGLQSPVLSSPSTPAPPYVQPYYAAPNPSMSPMPEERYEVDGISAVQGQRPEAHEMGSGK
ncbi:hypothetical protein P171DRAFT_443108 [Karstenula rhodostoma CBS 690.94]|uniref:Uncharacterized protein n=1 Tax=Karstenula rhodostoma CBS 690.94 TaxID=1392251 RepID=A0A9P4UCP8_9PLEO|nr:hypothetical protein P171DRAFT_443108 [Karstenula rhodostoma CBS 690.94]